MNFFIVIALLVSLITTSSADAVLKAGVTPFAETFASILGTISATGVFAVVSPLILKVALIPLFALVKFLSKPLIYMGLTSYLMVALTPLILAKSGMTSPAFTSRSQSNGYLSSLDQLMSTPLSEVTSKTLSFFNIESEECKMHLSCKIGKKFASNPYLYLLVEQSGAKNWIAEKYMANMVKSMTDSTPCDYSCQSLLSDYENSITTTTISPKTTPIPSTLDTINRIIQWLG